MKNIPSFFCLLLGLLVPSKVVIASCCASSSAVSVGRLSKHERASVSMNTALQATFGNFSEQARHQFGVRSYQPPFAWQNSLELMTRLASWFEPVIIIPTEVKWSQQRIGASLGDVSAGARIGAVPYEYWNRWPTLTLVTLVKAPLGESGAEDKFLQPEAITSAGVWWISPSVLVEKSIKNIVIGLSYGIELPLKPSKIDMLWPGLKNNGSFGISGPLVHNWAWSISNVWMWQNVTRTNNEPLLNTDKRRVSVSAALLWSIHSHIKLKSSLGIDVPIHHLGKNLPANLTLGLAMRIGVYE